MPHERSFLRTAVDFLFLNVGISQLLGKPSPFILAVILICLIFTCCSLDAHFQAKHRISRTPPWMHLTFHATSFTFQLSVFFWRPTNFPLVLFLSSTTFSCLELRAVLGRSVHQISSSQSNPGFPPAPTPAGQGIDMSKVYALADCNNPDPKVSILSLLVSSYAINR